jgi:hypothetical protein
MLAQHEQGPEFYPQHHKKKKEKKNPTNSSYHLQS